MGDGPKEHPKKVSTCRGVWEFTQSFAHSIERSTSNRTIAAHSLQFSTAVCTTRQEDVAETPKEAGKWCVHG